MLSDYPPCITRLKRKVSGWTWTKYIHNLQQQLLKPKVEMELYTAEAISQKLANPSAINDIGHCKMLLSKVMMVCSDDHSDLTPLLPHMMTLLAHSDLTIKKMACHFLTQTSQWQSEFMLLAVNTLLKDFAESNPMVRGLALRSICSIRHEAFAEHRLRCIHIGLDDGSAYVRRVAVLACLSLSAVNASESLLETGVIDKLYSLIRDTDPVVSVNCLVAIEEILQHEGGIVLSKGMVRFLLNRIQSYTTWGVVYVLTILKKYKPKSENEIFDIMNMLDGYFQHNSSNVVIQVLELFLHLTQELPHLQPEVHQRCAEPFLNVLSSGNVEMMVVVIEYLQKHPREVMKVLSSHSKVFFCRVKDPGYLKEQKIAFLVAIVGEENVQEILEEIKMNCTDKNKGVSLCAIQALGKIPDVFPDLSGSVVKMFNKLLESDVGSVVSNTLQVLVSLKLEHLTETDAVALQLCNRSKHVTDENGKCAVLNLIGRYGGNITESIYILEDYIETFHEISGNVKSQFLITALQLFAKRPSECQSILGEILECCSNDPDPDIQDQGKFYYGLLQTDINTAISVFQTLA